MTTSTPILSNAQLHAALTNWWRKRKRPATRRPFAGIEIDVECGYGAAADVPRIFVQAIRLLAAHWYEHRTDAAQPALPDAVAELLAPVRRMRM